MEAGAEAAAEPTPPEPEDGTNAAVDAQDETVAASQSRTAWQGRGFSPAQREAARGAFGASGKSTPMI